MSVLVGTAIHANDDDDSMPATTTIPSSYQVQESVAPGSAKAMSSSSYTTKVPSATPTGYRKVDESMFPPATSATPTPTPKLSSREADVARAEGLAANFWDKAKNLASYLNFYQMYKNYRDSEVQAVLKRYPDLSREQLDEILLKYPDFYAYSDDGRDAVVVFARNEQELIARNNQLDEILFNSIDAKNHALSEAIKDLKQKTSSASTSQGLKALRDRIGKFENEQFAMLNILQDMQKEVIKVKTRALDQLSRPLVFHGSTQTLLTGAPQPNRYISPYRSQEQAQPQAHYRTANAPAARSASAYSALDAARPYEYIDDYNRQNVAPSSRQRVVQFVDNQYQQQ